ncbi:hypothetical protein SUGI_1494080 [Cryptomeria japonica]|uniref:Uncharacterized protein n=1 Tax=Cryptomeria japonica TaxID=3369 RepID=A0AAD3RRP1_CRYJA|nr:hypothetical protein SUGI_1224220 [Cryptomeria japonica]GLJ59140.1 hypothetical protein SUGI_1494080 [Cryptomeria japonica]
MHKSRQIPVGAVPSVQETVAPHEVPVPVISVPDAVQFDVSAAGEALIAAKASSEALEWERTQGQSPTDGTALANSSGALANSRATGTYIDSIATWKIGVLLSVWIFTRNRGNGRSRTSSEL